MKASLILFFSFMIIFNSSSQQEKTIYDRGAELFNNKEFSKSISFYDSIIKIYPDSSLLYSSRAGVFYWIENYEKALSDCYRAIDLDSSNFSAFYNRGLIYLNTNDDQLALRDFDRTIFLKPEFGDAYNYRGTVYANLGQLDKSLVDFNKSIKINPNNGMTYYGRAVLYGIMNNTTLELQDYNQALKLDQTIANAYMNRGILKARDLKDFKGANQDFSSYLALLPNDVDALMNRGMTFIQLKNYKAAKLDYQKVLKLEPMNKKATKKLEELNKY